MRPRRAPWLALVLFAAALAAVPGEAASPPSSKPVNWSTYLYSPAHSSYNPLATAITPATVPELVQTWRFVPDTPPIRALGGFYSSPTVYDGSIFIGARNGVFYALRESNGAVIWRRPIGYRRAFKCGPEGFTATATVAPDPKTGRPTVYTYAADGRLYALDAATGNDVWPPAAIAVPSPNVDDYYAWSSPLVYGGHVYVGISSHCDEPLVQGGLREVNQATGAIENTYWTVPAGSVGGSVWSSAAASGSSLFVTTGNGPDQGDGYSIVRLDAQTLARRDIWTLPVPQRDKDSDFGGSPTLFTADLAGTPTQLVGACNKNGKYYALRAQQLSAGPVWTIQLGNPDSVGPGQCDAGAVWDGRRLFLAGNGTKIGGTAYGGSIQEVDPATGAAIWQTGLSGPVEGTPTMDGGGVIAVVTFGQTNALYLIDASTGKILHETSLGASPSFAQPVFADDGLFVATRALGLHAYRVVIKPTPARASTTGFRLATHAAKVPTRCSGSSTRARVFGMLASFDTGNGYQFAAGFAGKFAFRPYPHTPLAPANGFAQGRRAAIVSFVHERFAAGDGWTATALDLQRPVPRHPKVVVYRLGLQVRVQGKVLLRTATVAMGCLTGHVRSWVGPNLAQ
jgi:polyvinyl alcohol dehydrogenase (cytochrome)